MPTLRSSPSMSSCCSRMTIPRMKRERMQSRRSVTSYKTASHRTHCFRKEDQLTPGADTESLVDEVIHAIRAKSYVPGYVPPKPALPPHSNSWVASADPSTPRQSRKRSYGNNNGSEGGFQQGSPFAERPNKQPRRGRGGSSQRGTYNSKSGGTPGHIPQYLHGPSHMNPQMPPPAHMPPFGQSPHPGFPSLDPNDPASAIMALQAMGFPPLPGYPPLGPGPSASHLSSPSGIPFPGQLQTSMPPTTPKPRCVKWDKEGFCPAGNTCQFEHSEMPAPKPDNSNGQLRTPGCQRLLTFPQNTTPKTP